MTKGYTWILNESVVLQSHAIAVAQAVGLPFSLKRLQVTGPPRFLPAWVQLYLSPAQLLNSVASSEPLGPSWPRLVIAIGRRSVPIALSLKSLSEPRCFALHIRNRKELERQFDLVTAPTNDAFNGANVMASFDAVYSVTPMSHANEMRSVNDRLESGANGLISDTDVVASVIKGVLRVDRAET